LATREVLGSGWEEAVAEARPMAWAVAPPRPAVEARSMASAGAKDLAMVTAVAAAGQRSCTELLARFRSVLPRPPL